MKLSLPCKVILASGSPRRRELLQSLFDQFEVVVPDVNEDLLPNEHLEAATQRLAQRKGGLVAETHSGCLVIAADTLVGVGQAGVLKLLGKPGNRQAAVEMLRLLSSNTHVVVTGVSLELNGRKTVFSVTTSVTFRQISDAEIEAYVSSGEPMDKAGGYAIQGGASRFVKSVHGSLSNVIGLPLERLQLEIELLSASR